MHMQEDLKKHELEIEESRAALIRGAERLGGLSPIVRKETYWQLAKDGEPNEVQ